MLKNEGMVAFKPFSLKNIAKKLLNKINNKGKKNMDLP